MAKIFRMRLMTEMCSKKATPRRTFGSTLSLALALACSPSNEGDLSPGADDSVATGGSSFGVGGSSPIDHDGINPGVGGAAGVGGGETASGGSLTAGGGTGNGSGGSTESEPEPGVVGAPVGFASLNGGTTGGQGGEVVTVSTYAELKSYAESSSPYIILVQGTIENGSAGGTVRIRSNKSIVGIGDSAFLSGIGIEIRDESNIILQNLRVTLVGAATPSSVNGGDVISIRGTSRNLWIDHCELFSENPDTQTDIDKYDGLLDIRDQTGFITISWCYFHDHHKGGLVGASDTDLYADRKITFHHNYYNKVKLRVPMYRGATGHFFNNYIVGARDATELRVGTCVRVEKNYYESLRYSIYTPNDASGSAQRIDNIEASERAYPSNCTADIPYEYESVLTNVTNDVKTIVPQLAGVGKL